MVKGERQGMFCTIPNKCMELHGYLEEGGLRTIKGLDGQEILVPVNENRECKVGTPVQRLMNSDRTFYKATDNDFVAVVRADPLPSRVIKEDDKREALLQFMLIGFNYHIPLCDDNKEIKAGDIVGWTGTKWDKLESTTNGYIFEAVEGANANSGRYIDAYLKCYRGAGGSTDYEDFDRESF